MWSTCFGAAPPSWPPTWRSKRCVREKSKRAYRPAQTPTPKAFLQHPVGDEPDLDFAVSALDFMSCMAEGLGSPIAEVVQNTQTVALLRLAVHVRW